MAGLTAESLHPRFSTFTPASLLLACVRIIRRIVTATTTTAYTGMTWPTTKSFHKWKVTFPPACLLLTRILAIWWSITTGAGIFYIWMTRKLECNMWFSFQRAHSLEIIILSFSCPSPSTIIALIMNMAIQFFYTHTTSIFRVKFTNHYRTIKTIF